ncbi:MAG: PilN domain-containing protein [Desertifilum sp.]|nr:PilN domain-containing protein [Desertifilum sp.]MDI9637843.1 PilN domain-containing protein [Geitlerinema splendidum]
MYSLDINFLRDRPEYLKEQQQDKRSPKPTVSGSTPIIVGAVAAVALLGITFAAKVYLENENSKLAAELATLDQAIANQEAQKAQITQINQETEAIRSDTTALATVFNQITPWSALLEEVRERAPGNIQIENIQKVSIQLPPPDPSAAPADPNAPPAPTSVPGLEISGRARSYNDVNDFMLLLQNSDFFNGQDIRLVSANLQQSNTQVATPTDSNIEVRLPPVVQFQVRSALNDKPASEILAQLRRQGAEGLVERIQYLQQKGVIQ